MLHVVLLLSLLATAMAQSVCSNPIPMGVNEEDAITLFPQNSVCIQLDFSDAQRLPGRSVFFGYEASSIVLPNPIQNMQATLYNASSSAAITTVGPVSSTEQSTSLCLAADELPQTVWYVLTSQSTDNLYVNVQVSALDEEVDSCNADSFTPFVGCDNPQNILVNQVPYPILNVTSSSCWFVYLTDEQREGAVTIGFEGESGEFRSVSEIVYGEDGKLLYGPLAIPSNDTISLLNLQGSDLPSEFYLLFSSNASAVIEPWVNAPGVPAPPALTSSSSSGGLGWWWIPILMAVAAVIFVLVAGVFIYLKKRAAAKEETYDDYADF